MEKKKVLFVCIHNSARSQMAEAFLNNLARDRFAAVSAGLDPGKLNPLVVQVMKETAIDISHKNTQSVFDLLKAKAQYDYVITVCDESQSEKCPIFPGQAKKIHWSFADPSQFQGAEEEKLAQTRIVRDQIKQTIAAWLKTI